MPTLQSNQNVVIVNQLTDIFHGRSIAEIDAAVTKAKGQVITEITENRIDALAALFDSQMQTLLARSCPKKIIKILEAKKHKIINKAIKTPIAIGHIPFIPVIQAQNIGLDTLMKMVRNRGNKGRSYLNQYYNITNVPAKPYFIIDVENGGANILNQPLEETNKLINGQVLTIHETIALCVHTKVLEGRGLDCTGSRVENDRQIPNICIKDNKPTLDWKSTDECHEKWGSASCFARIV